MSSQGNFTELITTVKQRANDVQQIMDQLERQCRGVEALSPEVSDLITRAERSITAMESAVAAAQDVARALIDAAAQNRQLDRYRDQLRFTRTDLKRHKDVIKRAELCDPARLLQQAPFVDGIQTAASYLSRESEALDRTRRNLNDMRGVALSTWDMLRRQGQTLSSQSGRVSGVIGSMGSANSIMRTITRTDRMDALLVYGGIAGLIVLLLFIVWVKTSRGGSPDTADM